MSAKASTWFGPTETPNAERWHGDLLALDPSVNSPGVALYRHGCLFASERVKIPHADECSTKPARCAAHCIHALPFAQRGLRVASECFAWWLEQRDGHEHVIRTFVYEVPQVYSESEGKSKGDPNQLLGLVAVGQSLAVLVTAYNVARSARPPELVSPTPAEWTGQRPKTVKGKLPKDPRESPRGQYTWSRLELAEQKVAVLQHDAFDAKGLGLFALGRYDRTRVFPGAV